MVSDSDASAVPDGFMIVKWHPGASPVSEDWSGWLTDSAL